MCACVCVVSLYVGRVARGPSRTGIRNLICSRDDSQPLSNCSHHSGQIRPPFVHAKHQPGSFDVLDINVRVRVQEKRGNSRFRSRIVFFFFFIRTSDWILCFIHFVANEVVFPFFIVNFEYG